MAKGKRINSKRKGNDGELEWRDWLRDNLGCTEARRGRQYKGTPDSPDVEKGIPGTFAEVKRVQSLNLQAAMDKAVEESGVLIPYVAHRKNHKNWLITLQAEDLIAFARAVCDLLPEE